MADDLVKRLRDWPVTGITTHEAADRIGQLEQRLEATKDKAEAAILDLMAERDRAEARIEVLVREAILDAKLLADTQALLDKAVDALRRIADAADRKHVGDIARAVLAEIEGRRMSDMIDLEVNMVHRARGIAILSDGQEIQITNWIDMDGNECDHADAVACACGPDFDGKYYAVALGSFVEVKTQ